MTAKSYSLGYQGYWPEVNAKSIPAQSGVYSVYACRYNRAEDTVSIRKLFYIGEAQNVRNRVAGHEKLPIWRLHLAAGEELCFNFSPIVADRVRVEAALIHRHKPPENSEYVSIFPYETTTVSTSGRNRFLASHFTVYPTAKRAALLAH